MPDNTIAQNLVIFSPAGPYLLKTPAGVTIQTESSPLPAPPTTTSLIDNPGQIIVQEVVGAQHY